MTAATTEIVMTATTTEIVMTATTEIVESSPAAAPPIKVCKSKEVKA